MCCPSRGSSTRFFEVLRTYVVLLAELLRRCEVLDARHCRGAHGGIRVAHGVIIMLMLHGSLQGTLSRANGEYLVVDQFSRGER
jgi:hypothetical protein